MIAISTHKQTIFDVCLWKYGTLQEVSRVIRDNDMNYDIDLQTGTEVDWTENIGIEKNKRFYESNKYIPSSIFTPAYGDGSGIGFWAIGSTFIVQ